MLGRYQKDQILLAIRKNKQKRYPRKDSISTIL